MRATRAIIFKEFRQIRWFLFWGVAVFLVFPLLEATAQYLRGDTFRTDMPEGIVVLFGSFFAIITAVGIVCPELKRGLLVFWRSKPIGIWKWIFLKYAVGLFVILLVTIVPLIMELLIHRSVSPNRSQDFLYTVLSSHTFTIILVYSLSFLISCLVRKTTHAAILSFAIMLLIYFFPMLVPSLEKLSIMNLLFRFKTPFRMELVEVGSKYVGEGLLRRSENHLGYWFSSPKWACLRLSSGKFLVFHYFSGYFLFVLTMIAGSVVAFILSGLAIMRDWRVKMEQKLFCWSLGLVVLLIFSTIAFSFGSNLKCKETIKLSRIDRGAARYFDNLPIGFVMDGKKGLYVGWKQKPGGGKDFDLCFSEFGLDNVGIISEQIFSGDEAKYYSGVSSMGWSAERPEIVWLLKGRGEDLGDGSTKRSLYLSVVQLNKESQSAVEISELELGSHVSSKCGFPGGRSFVLHKGTIHAYIYGKYLKVDAKDPRDPQIIETVESYSPMYGEGGGDGKAYRTLRLVPDSNLSLQERLDIAVELLGHSLMAVEGELLAVVSEDFIRAYKLVDFKGDKAKFESIGYRQPTSLERLLPSWADDVVLKNGLLYVVQQVGFNKGLTVFDITEAGVIRNIGHYNYAEETFQDVFPMEDGDIVLGGLDIHILESPQR